MIWTACADIRREHCRRLDAVALREWRRMDGIVFHHPLGLTGYLKIGLESFGSASLDQATVGSDPGRRRRDS
jgi:hypothetical protein